MNGVDPQAACVGVRRAEPAICCGTRTMHFTLLDHGIDRARPTHIHNHFTSTPTDVVATRFGLEVSGWMVVSACSSSIAIGYAGLIRAGRRPTRPCAAGSRRALTKPDLQRLQRAASHGPGSCVRLTPRAPARTLVRV